MSKAIEKALRLKHEIRLAQAISEFEACFSKEQKASLHASRSSLAIPRPADVMRLIAELDREYAGPRCFGPDTSTYCKEFSNLQH
jgi:hypothetical protein